MSTVKYDVKRLGVNVDHVATLRQARGTDYPSPLQAAQIACEAGADGITIHLREDRRHIQDHDVWDIRQKMNCHLNLEMALTEEMLEIALNVQPDYVCLVPEKREELTTEGGLNLLPIENELFEACRRLNDTGIKVSLFIEASEEQIDVAKRSGANAIELHTGAYAELSGEAQAREFDKIREQAAYASGLGLEVNAGHGLHVDNVAAIVSIPEIYELNIGHSLIADSVFLSLAEAVKRMKLLMVS